MTNNNLQNDAQAAAKTAENALSRWKLNGWAALALMAAANLIGVFLHF